jgi:hypothetical protein
MQAHIEMLEDIVFKGVSVDRDEPDTTNGLTWRITFLDDPPAEPLDFTVSLSSNFIYLEDDSLLPDADIEIEMISDGAVSTECVGTHVVPDRALDPGQFYYVRVFAENEIGFSLAQSSLSAQKPMVVPGAPSNVVISVFSSTELRVTFNPPVDDGGDTITSYLIEYSTSNAFTAETTSSTVFSNLGAGAPFFKKISNLVTGTFYFVRVSAYNSQGYSPAANSVPSSLNPYQTSEGPSNVLLRSTSSSMITVSWEAPVINGGDAITLYRVEWDTDPKFNSVNPKPHKGVYDIIDIENQKSYTITNLEEGRLYYLRVFAMNSAGLSPQALSSPISTRPQLNIPGKPHTIVAISGDFSGEVAVSWQAPFVPWHQIPCSGTKDSPEPCPTEIGGGVSAAYGGGQITEYQVTYNELEDFSGFDTGSATTSQTYLTLTGLTPGRTYYVKVLARNYAGASSFCSFTNQYCLDLATREETVVSVTSKA